MKYFEFQIEEAVGTLCFRSQFHIIEAETEKQAWQYALAYLKDFRGDGTRDIEEGKVAYGCGLFESLGEIAVFREIERFEWIQKQVERMTLKYDQGFVDDILSEEEK